MQDGYRAVMNVVIWDQVLAVVETRVNRHIFNTWFRPTSFIRDEGTRLLVGVPSNVFGDWLTRHYKGVLSEALTSVGRSGIEIAFVAQDPPPVPDSGSLDHELPPPEEQDAPVSGARLNPRYTFDTFVVASSNQFAHAACRAVAEAPSRSYNPLYIYGGVGLGKTHLMHAVGHYVLRHMTRARLTYISAERFMNEMINALKLERIIEFRERYRNVEVLLIDDVQFMAGKEGTQVEFFHTFNALYDASKQIVITSDCPPHEIPQLEERLRSRFNWGLIADIQPPDLETKVAILKKKAEAEAVPLPDSVALYIASKIKSNIRELEGSLIRLVAYASLTGREITVALAHDVLKNILSSDERAVTIDAVQKFVADYYQLRLSELRSKDNSKSVVMPRQIAMFLSKELTNASLPEIGRAFNKHHSTVIHSIGKVEDLRHRDADFNRLINSFIDNFR
jgi:chromosomal replication initiator protein